MLVLRSVALRLCSLISEVGFRCAQTEHKVSLARSVARCHAQFGMLTM